MILLGVAFEYLFYLGDVVQIFFLTLFADARTCTVLDVIFQAYVEFPGPDVFWREVQVASA